MGMVCVAREQRSAVKSIKEKQGRLGGCVCVREWKRYKDPLGFIFPLKISFMKKERCIHFFHVSQHVDKATLSKITDFFDSIGLSHVFSFSAAPPGEDTTAEENELAD